MNIVGFLIRFLTHFGKGRIALIFLLLLFSDSHAQCLKGDLNGDGVLTSADVVQLINCVFLGTGNCDNIFVDATCDSTLNASDVVISLNAVFLGLPITCGTFDYPAVTKADDSTVPESLRNEYWEDAAWLALQKAETIGGKPGEEIEFPSGLVQTLYNALIHIYNASEFPATDSVVNIYKIHTYNWFYTSNFGIFAIGVDTTIPWVKKWQQGQTLTGNPRIDHLFNCFDLSLGYFDDSRAEAILVETRPVNVSALPERFEGIEGVRYADMGSHNIGEGYDIAAETGNNYWQLDYSAACGDCWVGCALRHFWRFKVYSDGQVEFIGGWGPPVPNPCNW